MFNPEIKYLVTTDNWFIGPDGEQYRAAWGNVEVFTAQDVWGFTPARSTNWFAKVGGAIIAGCQIHYAVECPKAPARKQGRYKNKDTGEDMPFNNIYISE
jgi:hypothetical protein